MTFILLATSILTLIAALIAFVLQGGLSKKRRRTPGFWRRFLLRQALLLPLYVFVLLPGLLGGAGSRMVRTRHDERAYTGPRIDQDGIWRIQNRQTLRQEGTDPRRQADNGYRIAIPSPDGPQLAGYFVPCKTGTPRAVALLVHGLFRNAMEVEPVAAMFRDLGADVMLLELRNHGGSEMRPFTFGLHEKHDVLAGVEFLRRRPGGLQAPLILFGVSMGGVAAARAAPEIPELRGLVLDAPMTDLAGTVHRQLGRIGWQGRRGLGLPAFYVSLVAWSMELWSGFDIDAVRPIDQLRTLPATLPALFVGAGRDVRVPPPVVTAAFEALRSPAALKELWIGPTARHGKVWTTYPAEYRQRLTRFFDRVAKNGR